MVIPSSPSWSYPVDYLKMLVCFITISTGIAQPFINTDSFALFFRLGGALCALLTWEVIFWSLHVLRTRFSCQDRPAQENASRLSNYALQRRSCNNPGPISAKKHCNLLQYGFAPPRTLLCTSSAAAQTNTSPWHPCMSTASSWVGCSVEGRNKAEICQVSTTRHAAHCYFLNGLPEDFYVCPQDRWWTSRRSAHTHTIVN